MDVKSDEPNHTHIHNDKFKKYPRKQLKSIEQDDGLDLCEPIYATAIQIKSESLTTDELTEDTYSNLNDSSFNNNIMGENQIENGSIEEDDSSAGGLNNEEIKLEPLDIEDIYSAETCASITAPQKHFCYVCSSFVTFEDRDVHNTICVADRNSQHNKDNPFVCPVCDYKCLVKGNFQKHLLRRHNPNAKQLTCKRCSNVFLTKSRLEQHESKCTYNYRVSIKCEICGVILCTKFSYKKHVLRFHSVTKTTLCASMA